MDEQKVSDSKKWWLWGIVFVVLIIVGFLIFKKPLEAEPIKIGYIGPLTGENAVIGEGIKNAISLSGKNKNVQIIYEDDQFNTKLGVTAYHKLRDIDKVDAIINTTPSVIDAITPLLNENPIVVIQIAEPELSTDDSIFQIMPSGATLYDELGKIAKNKYSSFAFVYQNGATFEKAKNFFKKSYEDSLHQFQEYRLDNSKDYKTLIAKIKNDNIEAYTIIATPSVGVQFIKQLNEQQVGSILLCNADMEVTIGEYLKVLPDEIFNGCVSTMFASRMSDIFKTEYKNTFKIEPGFASDYGYDAISILIKTHSLNLETQINSLKDLEFNGVSGKISFNSQGVRIPEIEEHVFKNGLFVKIED